METEVVLSRCWPEIQIRWTFPLEGWVHLNCVGAFRGDSITVGCGGVLRCASGAWIVCFARGLGSAKAHLAELWSVFVGLKLARDRGF